MDTFDTSRKKIRKLSDQVITNSDLINKKINDDDRIALDNILINQLRVLDDTDDVSIDATSLSVINIDQNKLIPVNYKYWYENTFNIPSIFFPFIDFEFGFSSPIDRLFVPFVDVQVDNWDGNFYDVKGDGSKIWSGITPPSAYPEHITTHSYNTYTVTRAQIDDGLISENHTRPSWQATVEWTDSGTQYRLVSALLVGYISKHYDTSTSPCGGNTDYYIMQGAMYYDSHCQYPAGNFVNIVGQTFTVMGRKSHIYWTGTELACLYHETHQDGITKIFDLYSGLNSVMLWGTRQRKSGSVWVNDPLWGGTAQSAYYDIPTGEITSFSAVKNRYLPYWDVQRRFLFSINFHGFPVQPDLANMPIVTVFDVLPYTTITYDVNPSDYPHRVSERNGNIKSFYNATTDANGSVDPFWIRSSKTTDSEEKWMVRFAYAALRMIEATELTNVNILFWNESWWQDSGHTFYEIGDFTHTTKAIPYWNPLLENVSTRVIARARSWLYFKKTQKSTKVTS